MITVFLRLYKADRTNTAEGSFTPPLFLCSNGRFLEVELHVGLQSGVTFLGNWGYTFRVLRGGDRGVEKYRFFKMHPRF